MENVYMNLIDVSKTYQHKKIIDIDQLSIRKGEIISVVGPSGIGKSTLLKMIAGLEGYDTGDIIIDGYSMNGVSPQERPVIYLFQESLLFPHLDLLENVTFGLRMAKVKKKVRDQIGIAMLEKVGLKGFTKRYPHELSGGQKQRVALARSLVLKPKVLLLDEPFSNLDPELRKDTRRWMKQLLKKEEMTVLFVTHDLEEAMALGDRVAILGEGRLQQVATPSELYDAPINPYVTTFLQSGIWKEGQFISQNSLIFTEVTPIKKENSWKAEVIEVFYKSGENYTVVILSDTGEKLTVQGPNKYSVGNIVYIKER
ncbi:ABC transporter ATP-binding protein [Jeotgalibaca sp. MA1X17-3]|uniref:ABC transporter ATP-binding protein n=1 Tax=Jeotgalibaca sp. MA1X17-3 TaxID=2908211 RepID=UPI001F2CC42E|nr:ABC transporter ATP-binding protein [Jeotgalibaca sp. MA1X17-3]UJF16023.1 ABC transporter ATP-binding protein [Jeotgalibaca sp. MA1X17-3]